MDWNDFLEAVEDYFPPAPADELRTLERELGCTLPPDYREFLIARNGGVFRGNQWFNEPLADGRPADVGLHHVYGIRGVDHFSLQRARECYQSASEVRIPLSLLPIADDPGGNAICLGIAGEHYGKIYFWDHEREPDPTAWDGRVESAENIEFLSSSLTEFVAGLRLYDETPPGLAPGPDERLRSDWQRWCEKLGLRGDVAAVWEQLQSLYGQSWRAYHNFTHVEDCLLQYGLCWELAMDWSRIEAAIWFHDAIYNVGAQDNEERSAALARECLTDLGASGEFVEQVVDIILATDHRRQPGDLEAQLLCDIDLKVLGCGIDIYDRYADAICTEVGLPEHEYAPHRRVFLRKMLERKRIFHTDLYRRQYESAARINMRRELGQWKTKLEQ